jgi:2-iminoacetate synthase
MFNLDDQKILKYLDSSKNLKNFSNILQKDHFDLTEEDFACLICADIDDNLYEKLALKAREITLKRFGMVKGLYIPLYLSNFCNNSCIYCGFRKENKISRKTLTNEEIEQELTDIYQKGFRNILLVSGEWNNFENINYLANGVKIAKKIGFHSISVELGSLPEEYSKKLTEAGSEIFVLYQETYHPETYDKVHISGLKKNYQYRLDAHERALKAGFRKVNFGFLAGLFDAKFEALAMYQHLQYIRKNFYSAEIGISIPRITNAIGVDVEKYHVDDKLYARILMAFRLAFPDITISLSTRENKIFRDGMTDICITHLSVESKTMPGGYHSSNKQDLEQFAVVDDRNMSEIIFMLKNKGYDIHVKDWEQSLSSGG